MADVDVHPLNVTTTISSDRSPWPGTTLVLTWIDGDGGRLYPLPLLDRHGIVLDKRSGRRVAATWSAKTGTATLLALPGDIAPIPSTIDLSGWQRVRDPVSGAEWLPGVHHAVAGDSKQALSSLMR